MSFKEEVKKSLRTKDQIKQEQFDKLNQENEKVAKYILNIIKKEILRKARLAKITNDTISGRVIIPHSCGYDDDIPYGNIFKAEFDNSIHRTGGLFGYRDSYWSKMEINNIYRLNRVFSILKELSLKDGIIVGKPFILCKILDIENNATIKEKAFLITNNTLSATVTTTRRSHSGGWRGETATLNLAINFTYKIQS